MNRPYGKLQKCCVFVCLFTHLLLAETHLGPDGTRLGEMFKPGFISLYKYAGLVVYGIEKYIDKIETA